jgi:hypothetical protein
MRESASQTAPVFAPTRSDSDASECARSWPSRGIAPAAMPTRTPRSPAKTDPRHQPTQQRSHAEWLCRLQIQNKPSQPRRAPNISASDWHGAVGARAAHIHQIGGDSGLTSSVWSAARSAGLALIPVGGRSRTARERRRLRRSPRPVLGGLDTADRVRADKSSRPRPTLSNRWPAERWKRSVFVASR